jgi:hypothetical protein
MAPKELGGLGSFIMLKDGSFIMLKQPEGFALCSTRDFLLV